jgi:hypothetical protein
MDDARGLVGDSVNCESDGKWMLHAYVMKVIAEMRVRMEYLCFTDQLAAFSGSSGPSKSNDIGILLFLRPPDPFQGPLPRRCQSPHGGS